MRLLPGRAQTARRRPAGLASVMLPLVPVAPEDSSPRERASPHRSGPQAHRVRLRCAGASRFASSARLDPHAVLRLLRRVAAGVLAVLWTAELPVALQRRQLLDPGGDLDGEPARDVVAGRGLLAVEAGWIADFAARLRFRVSPGRWHRIHVRRGQAARDPRLVPVSRRAAAPAALQRVAARLRPARDLVPVRDGMAAAADRLLLVRGPEPQHGPGAVPSPAGAAPRSRSGSPLASRCYPLGLYRPVHSLLGALGSASATRLASAPASLRASRCGLRRPGSRPRRCWWRGRRPARGSSR